MAIERDKSKEMMSSASPWGVRKVIAVFVMIAGMVPTCLGILQLDIISDIVSFSVIVGLLILGVLIIFLGIIIWHWGEFNAKKMAGNYFTTIGVSCIIGAIVSFLYLSFSGSPAEVYIYLVTIFFGTAGIVIGRAIKRRSKF